MKTWMSAIGAATLRRDGFCGMVADGNGEIVTRPLTFIGSHLRNPLLVLGFALRAR